MSLFHSIQHYENGMNIHMYVYRVGETENRKLLPIFAAKLGSTFRRYSVSLKCVCVCVCVRVC